MKTLKNIFGSKNKQNSKYEPNTLAEINESPDLRLATAKEKEADIPLSKSEKIYKIPKSSSQSTAKSTKQTTKKAQNSSKTSADSVDEKDNKKSETVAKTTSNSSTSNKKASTKKATEKDSVDTNKKNVSTAESKPAKAGKFEIKKSKDGGFVFNLYASNNLIVATSQVYTSSTSAMNGIKSVIANAPTAPIEDQTLKKVVTVPFPKWEIYLDKGEEYRFRLCASNGSCVCHSQGYTSKASCKKGIESIIKFASDAEITKVYLDKEK